MNINIANKNAVAKACFAFFCILPLPSLPGF